VTIFDDLAAEQDRLELLLTGLDQRSWAAPSAAPGWTVRDVMVHLGQTEEAVAASIANADRADLWERGPMALDDAVDQAVRAEAAPADLVFERWRTARRAALAALRGAEPERRVPWASAPLKPTVLATTRLAEHWAHALDIAGPLAIAYDDTDRIRHVAWLGHRTLPYAFTVEGLEVHEVYCELIAPGGETWRYGPPDADSTITGPAGDFCRVGARRLAPADSRLVTSGPHAQVALEVLRNYAV
jgi:uncharacterized protein (TIGR03084 family)